MARNTTTAATSSLPYRSSRLGFVSNTHTPPHPSAATLHSSSRKAPSYSPPKLIRPCFSEYLDSAGQRFELRYTGRLTSDIWSKPVFLATVHGPDDTASTGVVVKFTETYGEEAHRLTYNCGFAPLLRLCAKVESVGMRVIVTDYVEGDMAISPLGSTSHSATPSRRYMLLGSCLGFTRAERIGHGGWRGQVD
ncbi:uncharacterized protein C8Q71DRAFT_454827 [Rhodofomes roseus]|uniref:Uncharacterized protein n=1 Tax=Rhodofomes roseus TaxID=34475 RepID=A0ABQ8JYU8_9APHY|nr:uncharacterized protein C8Q71DRAFT_454827 [Rhodofomes roseus]KAH9828791.1 hypothetical protein C8Q71DRAFT_454827 [Rhodofomes roseus]